MIRISALANTISLGRPASRSVITRWTSFQRPTTTLFESRFNNLFKPMSTTPQAIDDQFLAPKGQKVCKLECREAFKTLSSKEAKYAHHFGRASWYGGLISCSQVSYESPQLLSLICKLFRTDSVDALRAKVKESDVAEEDYDMFLDYVACTLGNLGPYLSFGDTKFVPRLPESTFKAILALSSDASVASDYGKLNGAVYRLNANEKELGFPPSGITSYYSPDITQEVASKVQELLDKECLSALNTRLFHRGGSKYEVLVTSKEKKESSTHEHKGLEIEVTYGDFSLIVSRIVEHLELAIPYAANEHQTKMLEHYVNHFKSGDVELHKNSQSVWVKDLGPAVETNIGFVETYRDPLGVRAEFEGFVAVVNKETSRKFGELVAQAEKFIPILPWTQDFEKDTFTKPDFTALEVLFFATSGIPAGISLPNYDDLRQNEGFKNVSLSNILSARVPEEKTSFLRDEDQKLFFDWQSKAFEVQVGLHELLGHGSGRLLMEDKDGGLNFDKTSLVNPLTGKVVESWYKHGESWNSKFAELSNTMEECRAECVGLHLCLIDEVQNIFGFTGQESEDCMYINWLNMCRAGILALEQYSPERKSWGQAHMQARFAILRTLLAHGDGVVELDTSQPGDIQIKLDRAAIKTKGREAIANFLRELQILKATADYATGSAMYNKLTAVEGEWLEHRKIVMAKRQPRKVFVQPTSVLAGDDVKLVEYDPSPAGIVQSFLDRFGDELPSLVDSIRNP